MTYSHPQNTVWFIEAKPDVRGESNAKPQHGSAIAVRLLNSETGEPKNYLLTCLHVVCRINREKINGVVTDVEPLNHISCWPPGHGFNESQRLDAKLASETRIPPNMLGRKLLIGEDWVLLDVSEPSFQKVPVARAWDDPVDPLSSKHCEIIGYPAGSSGFTKGIVESLHLKKIPISRDGGDFYLTVDGEGTREGMSGGGVFTDSGVLIGVHRSAQAQTNALYAVRIRDIRDELGDKKLQPVKRPLAQALFDGVSDIFVMAGLPTSVARRAVFVTPLLLIAAVLFGSKIYELTQTPPAPVTYTGPEFTETFFTARTNQTLSQLQEELSLGATITPTDPIRVEIPANVRPSKPVNEIIGELVKGQPHAKVQIVFEEPHYLLDFDWIEVSGDIALAEDNNPVITSARLHSRQLRKSGCETIKNLRDDDAYAKSLGIDDGGVAREPYTWVRWKCLVRSKAPFVNTELKFVSPVDSEDKHCLAYEEYKTGPVICHDVAPGDRSKISVNDVVWVTGRIATFDGVDVTLANAKVESVLVGPQ